MTVQTMPFFLVSHNVKYLLFLDAVASLVAKHVSNSLTPQNSSLLIGCCMHAHRNIFILRGAARSDQTDFSKNFFKASQIFSGRVAKNCWINRVKTSLMITLIAFLFDFLMNRLNTEFIASFLHSSILDACVERIVFLFFFMYRLPM